MEFTDVLVKRRTIRKYRQEKIPLERIEGILECARLSPSASNRQPLEYLVIIDENKLEDVFQTVKWAGYIAPEGNPEEGEKPVAYVVILIRSDLKSAFTSHDAGAAAQSILLACFNEGIGTCWLGSVDRERLRSSLAIPDRYIIDTVIAMGYPAESSEIFDITDSVKYFRKDNTYHVPKRRIEDILHINNMK